MATGTGKIYQIYDGSTAIFPRTVTSAVYGLDTALTTEKSEVLASVAATYLPTATANSTYLKLIGGTLSNTAAYLLTLNNTTSGATSSGIQFKVNNTVVGGLLATSTNTLQFYDTVGYRTVYHSGNSNQTTTGSWSATTFIPAKATPNSYALNIGLGLFDGPATGYESDGYPCAYCGGFSITGSGGLQIAYMRGNTLTTAQELCFRQAVNTGGMVAGYGSWYKFWTQANAGEGFPWKCTTLTISSAIYMPNNSPIYFKNAAGTVDMNAVILNANNDLLVGFDIGTNGYNTLIYGNSIYFRYGTSRATGFVLSSAGRVTIGASDLAATESNKLYVDGNLMVSSLGRFASHLTVGYGYAPTPSEESTAKNRRRLYFGDTSHYFMCIADGSFSISHGISVTGTVTSTGDQVISSDLSKKTHIEDLDLSVEQIAQMPAVSFEWKDGRGKSFGTIAQSVKPLFSQAVLGEEGNYTVAYAQGGWVFGVKNAREIVSIKGTLLIVQSHETEQDEEIARLKEEVKRLSSDNLRLKAKLNLN